MGRHASRACRTKLRHPPVGRVELSEIANATVIGARVALVAALDSGKVATLDLSVVHALGLGRALEIAYEAGVFRAQRDARAEAKAVRK